MTLRRLALPVVIGCLAAASLALPFTLVYDPWAWLVWGRELAELELDTSGGPSWKPLPVILTTAFAAAGDLAPELWLVVARAGWLACPALAWILAMRLTVRLPRSWRWATGALAATALVLLADSFTSWTRQFAGGLSEPLLVACVLGAVERALAGRHGFAFGLGVAAALLRPEAWPFVLAYAAWLWRMRHVRGEWLAAGLAAIPLLWFVPDLLGSGAVFTGAERARSATGSPPAEALEALGRALDLALWPLWATAAYAVYASRLRGERSVPVIGALAAAWIVLVALMAAAGYAGLPRFAAPAGALACVLGAVGVAELADEVRPARLLARRLRRVGLGFLVGGERYRHALIAATVAILAGLGLAMQAGLRIAEIPGEIDEAVEFEQQVDDLYVLREAVTESCGSLQVADLYFHTAVAWRAEVAISAVRVVLEPPARPGLLLIGSRSPRQIATAVRHNAHRVSSSGSWVLYEVGCRSNSKPDA